MKPISFPRSILAIILISISWTAIAQRVIPAPAPPGNAALTDEKKAEGEEELAAGVYIETSPEHNSLLRTASEFIRNGRIDDGILLIQRVLDTAGDSLTTQDHMVYRPIRLEAERLLNELKPDEFALYRARVDGEAKGLLKSLKKNRERKALEDVAKRLFLSSYGDDAAYLLGCLHVDAGRFADARRCFSRLLTAPRPISVPLDQVLLRYAFVCGQLGDAQSAKKALKRLDRRGSTNTSEDLITKVRQSLQKDTSKPLVGESWTMAYGTPSRTGLHHELSNDLDRIPRLVPRWSKIFRDDDDISPEEFNKPPKKNKNVRTRPTRYSALILPKHRRQAWCTNKWIPTDQIVSDGKNLYHRSANVLICRDSDTGECLWRSIGPPPRPTNTRNVYYNSAYQIPYKDQFFEYPAKSLTLIDGVVYHVDPKVYGAVSKQVNGMYQRANIQNNRLTATDANTGKLKWFQGHTTDKKSPFYDVRFLACPVKCFGNLLVPVDTKDGMYLMALSESKGEILWKIYLCGTTNSIDRYGRITTSKSENIDITIDGNEVYVCTGRGAVVALRAAGGDLLWASRYGAETDNKPTYYNRLPEGTQVHGWRSSTAFVYQNKLAAIASDSQYVHIFNRETGELEGSYKVSPSCLCIGFAGGMLIGTSAEGVFAFSVADRRLAWQLKLEGITGTGVITKSTLYVPQKNRIQRIAWRTGALLESIPVVLYDEHPVGNLFIDKNRIYAVGMETIVGLEDAESRLAGLAAQIKNGDVEAMLSRARLNLSLDMESQGLDDLRLAVKSGSKEASEILLTNLFRLARENAAKGLAYLDEAATIAGDAADPRMLQYAKALCLEANKQPAKAAEIYLKLAFGKGGLIDLNFLTYGHKCSATALGISGLNRILNSKAGASERFRRSVENEMSKAMKAKNWKAARHLAINFRDQAFAKASLSVEMSDLNLSQKEQFLLRMSESSNLEVSSVANIKLARLYEKAGWKWQAYELWKHCSTKATGKTQATCRQETARLGKELSIKSKPNPLELCMPAQPWKRLWSGDQKYVMAMAFTGWERKDLAGRNEFLANHFIGLDYRAKTMYCLELKTGKEVWKANLGNTTSYLRYGQSLRKGLIAYLRGPSSLSAMDLTTGKILWKKDASTTRYRRGGDNVYGDTILQLAGNGVQAIDCTTGEVLWTRSFMQTSVTATRTRDDRSVMLYLMPGQRTATCDLRTGEELSKPKSKTPWRNTYYSSYVRPEYAIKSGLIPYLTYVRKKGSSRITGYVINFKDARTKKQVKGVTLPSLPKFRSARFTPYMGANGAALLLDGKIYVYGTDTAEGGK